MMQYVKEKVLNPEVGKRFQRQYMKAIYLKKLSVTQVDGNGCKNLTIKATVKNLIASFTHQKVLKSVRKRMEKIKEKKKKKPYMRPEERERMKQFYVIELSTPPTPTAIKKTPSRKILQSWEPW